MVWPRLHRAAFSDVVGACSVRVFTGHRPMCTDSASDASGTDSIRLRIRCARFGAPPESEAAPVWTAKEGRVGASRFGRRWEQVSEALRQARAYT